MGDAGVADAAAVASNFERMVRIADAIGIELGDWMESFTEEVRADLALDRLREGGRPEDAHEHECRVTGKPARFDSKPRTPVRQNGPEIRPKRDRGRGRADRDGNRRSVQLEQTRERKRRR